MVELCGVSKHYGQAVALHTTSLTVPRGKTSVVIGPSGCGKSTLLRITVGLVTPTHGTVLFDGDLLTPANMQSIRLRIGYVTQHGGLFPHMTARANVTLMARHLRWDDDRIQARLEVLASLVHLPAACLERYPLRLSGGECQRVSIMRALFLDPGMLLMDEPLGALDPMIRYGLQEELRSICRELGKTVMLVTHDMAEAAFFGDSITLMRAGTVVQTGTIQDLVHRPASEFVQSFMRAQRGLHEWT